MPDGYREVRVESIVKTDERANRLVMEAYRTGRPLILRCPLTEQENKQLYDEWREYVCSDKREYPTQGRGPRTLYDIWTSDLGIRHEGGLKDTTVGRKRKRSSVELALNPVRDWLEHASRDRDSIGRILWRRQLWIDGLAERIKRLELKKHQDNEDAKSVRHPSFIAGRIKPGGGPTHYDEYQNLALLVMGQKTFYTAEHDKFVDQPIRGNEANERLGVNPFNSTEYVIGNSSLSLDRVDACNWMVGSLTPGDILFLPRSFWHWVWSQPKTIMTNDWA